MLFDSEKREGPLFSNCRELEMGGPLKEFLVDLMDSSKALDAIVWRDGVYTEIGDEQIIGGWMNDRDVYFKVEDRLDKRNGS